MFTYSLVYLKLGQYPYMIVSLVGLCPRDKFWFISMLGKHTIVHFLPLMLLYCGPFPYWTDIVDIFPYELIYCGHFSILNYGHFPYWLTYCGPFSILNWCIVDLFPYWTNVLWTLSCIELIYCGLFSILNLYIVDLFPYWTYILWTFFHIELMCCGHFSVLNLCIVDTFPYWTMDTFRID